MSVRTDSSGKHGTPPNERLQQLQSRQQLDDDLEIINVQILDIGMIPPHYFMRPEVIEAVRLHVRSDVISKGKPVPPGAQPIWAHRGTLAAAAAKLDVAKQDFRNSLLDVIKDKLPYIILFYAALSTVLIIWAIVKGLQ